LELGQTLRVLVTATNGAGSAQATSPATSAVGALAPSNTALPSIGGSLIDGSTVSALTGTWKGTPPLSYSYQWQLCNAAGESCKDISGALESTLALLPGDVGQTLRVLVTATNGAGSAQATSPATSAVGALAPSNTALPSIGGLLKVGQRLTATAGTWKGTPPLSDSYQWELCNVLGTSCSAIAKATEATYVLTLLDVGLPLRVTVTATNSAGSAQATSHVTGLVEAAGP
jgi:hypothetical protein